MKKSIHIFTLLIVCLCLVSCSDLNTKDKSDYSEDDFCYKVYTGNMTYSAYQAANPNVSLYWSGDKARVPLTLTEYNNFNKGNAVCHEWGYSEIKTWFSANNIYGTLEIQSYFDWLKLEDYGVIYHREEDTVYYLLKSNL